MKKVIVHNLSIPYAQPGPGHFNFDHGGIFFADAGDVIVTRESIPDAYIHFMRMIGHDVSQCHFISPPHQPIPIPKSIFADEYVRERVAAVIRKDSASTYALDSFMLTDTEAQWADAMGITYVGDPLHYYTFGNKSYFRKLMKSHDFSIPIGFEHQEDHISGAIKAALIILFYGGSEVVVKQDEGVAAFGSHRFTRLDLLQGCTRFDRLFPDPRKTGIVPTYSSAFVVEKWYRDVTSSPSIQLYIHPDKSVSVCSIHLQLFQRDSMRYAGCYSKHWITAELQSRLIYEGSKIGELIAQKGFRGHFTLNSIVLSDKSLLWVEINPRRVISSYPFQIAQKISDGVPDSICYISKSIQKDSWRGKDIDDVLNDLSPVLFPKLPQAQSGVIPFHYHYLAHSGTISLMCIGRTPFEAEHVFRCALAI